MGATEHETTHPRRRFVTRHDVEDAAAAGATIRLSGRDVLTHEAAQRVRDLGVLVERDGQTTGVRSGTVTGSPSASGSPASPMSRSVPTDASPDALRRAVRAAVVAELGAEPPDLDAVIARVLQDRGKA